MKSFKEILEAKKEQSIEDRRAEKTAERKKKFSHKIAGVVAKAKKPKRWTPGGKELSKKSWSTE